MRSAVRPAMVVMARAPVAGAVKTRLQPHLAGEQCASLYTAMLRDALDLAAAARGYRPYLAFTPADAGRLFSGILPAGLDIFPQPEGDLGRRMYGIVERCASRGHNATVIVGSDLPELQPETLDQALESLKEDDLCLGPATDGGYYLVGMKQPLWAIFDGIPWGTPGVLAATLERAGAAGVSCQLLDECGDVDIFEDLERLRRHIARLRAVPGAHIPAHTSRWLEDNPRLAPAHD